MVEEVHKRVGDLVDATLGAARTFPEGDVALYKSQVDELAQRPTQFRGRLTHLAGYLGQAIDAVADKRKKRGRERGLGEVIHKEAGRFLIECAVDVKDMITHRLHQRRFAFAKLPITGNTSPYGIFLDGGHGVALQDFLQEPNLDGCQLNDGVGAAIEWLGGVEHQPLHHLLRRTAKEYGVFQSLGIDELLKDRRQGTIYLH